MSAQKPAPTVLERESIVLVTELWAYQYVVTVFWSRAKVLGSQECLSPVSKGFALGLKI